MQTQPSTTPRPWWRHRLVWLVIAGPAAVVVAGIATAWIAIAHPDPVLDEDYYRHGAELDKAGRPAPPLVPALQGRNHAATPAANTAATAAATPAPAR